MALASRARSAHPRSRGENRASIGAGDRRAGSSPLTRGKHGRGAGRGAVRRLIPAHAGKTQFSSQFSYRKEAHPRSRGENRSTDNNKEDNMGSSPLTRGKHDGLVVDRAARRLIPAHAGKTSCTNRGLEPTGAHPRSRGENVRRITIRGGISGSSPLTRGKPRSRGRAQHERRLIPAHAGKTTSASTASSQVRAHPRSRGENRRGGTDRVQGSGSSPLTRGKLDTPPGSPRPHRLIPAHAGKTLYTN